MTSVSSILYLFNRKQHARVTTTHFMHRKKSISEWASNSKPFIHKSDALPLHWHCTQTCSFIISFNANPPLQNN